MNKETTFTYGNIMRENNKKSLLERLQRSISSIVMTLLLMTTMPLYAANVTEVGATSSGDDVTIKIEFDDQVKSVNHFSTNDPARIIVDLAGTGSKLVEKTQNINKGTTRSVSVIEAGDRTRVIVNLLKSSAYTIEELGNYLNISIQSNSTAKSKTSVQNDKSVIENIDFRRGEQGEAKLIISYIGSDVITDVGDEKGDIVVKLVNTYLPDDLYRNFDVIDFATPVNEIKSSRLQTATEFLLKTNQESEYLSYQTENSLIIEVKGVDKTSEDEKRFGFSGEKLSLNFQNIEVRAVLQLLADFNNLNLVTSDTVQGNLTLRLKDVPWDQALDIVLKAKGLGMRQSGNVMMVAPVSEIAARERQELEAQKQQVQLEKIYTEVFEINFASANDMMKLLTKSTGGSGSGDGNNAFLSDRGSISLDERTNSLLIRDTKERLEEIKIILTTLDKPVRQVLIESRIVIANDDFDKELGVRFGASKYGTSNSKYVTDYAVSGQLDQAENLIDGEALEYPNHLNVDLAAASPTGSIGLALAKLPFGLSLELELSAMQAEGQGEIISSPKVITANKKQATIEQGTEIPYQEASSSGATSVSFKSATLKLDVTPQITPEDQVIMDLEVSQDQVGTVFQNVPSIDTRKVATQVLVDNGETVVLGGIYEQTKTNSIEKVPFFADLPYVGFLFRTTSESDAKRELLVFVTLKIVKEGLQY
jgi:type IV pilus assembly protein PilQ